MHEALLFCLSLQRLWPAPDATPSWEWTIMGSLRAVMALTTPSHGSSMRTPIPLFLAAMQRWAQKASSLGDATIGWARNRRLHRMLLAVRRRTLSWASTSSLPCGPSNCASGCCGIDGAMSHAAGIGLETAESAAGPVVRVPVLRPALGVVASINAPPPTARMVAAIPPAAASCTLTDSQCGTKGAACGACTGSNHCIQGQCGCASSSGLPDVPGLPDEPCLLEQLWSVSDLQQRLLQFRHNPMHAGHRERNLRKGGASCARLREFFDRERHACPALHAAATAPEIVRPALPATPRLTNAPPAVRAAWCVKGAAATGRPVDYLPRRGAAGSERLQTCGTNGQWQNGNACAGGCVAGSCTACEPGSTQSCGPCGDGTLTCAADGTWGTCSGGSSPTTYYRDNDGDGYGNINVTSSACALPSGYVSDDTDCYDNNFNAHPGQAGWFTTDRGDGSFDYNCDGFETEQSFHHRARTRSGGCIGNCCSQGRELPSRGRQRALPNFQTSGLMPRDLV